MNASACIGDIIRNQPLRAFRLHSYGIDYLTCERNTIDEVSKKLGRPTTELVEQLNQTNNHVLVDINGVRNMTLRQITEYLTHSHHKYLKEHLPFVESLVKYFCHQYNLNKEFSQEISRYHNEFCKHLDLEEKVLFPYLIELEKLADFHPSTWQIYSVLQSYSIEQFERCHTNIEDQYSDLKDLLISNFSRFSSDLQSHVIVAELNAIEADLRLHAEIEDDVLVSMSRTLEGSLLSKVDRLAAFN